MELPNIILEMHKKYNRSDRKFRENDRIFWENCLIRAKYFTKLAL